MAIVRQEFETLVTGHGTQRCDYGELLARRREIKDKWQNDIVINENGVNFSLDKNLRFHYLTDYGKKKEADITQFAFSQLCARMGVPANYIKKCFTTGKEELALQNFRWGLINGVTELAQEFTLETRLDMENWARSFFAKAA